MILFWCIAFNFPKLSDLMEFEKSVPCFNEIDVFPSLTTSSHFTKQSWSTMTLLNVNAERGETSEPQHLHTFLDVQKSVDFYQRLDQKLVHIIMEKHSFTHWIQSSKEWMRSVLIKNCELVNWYKKSSHQPARGRRGNFLVCYQEII